MVSAVPPPDVQTAGCVVELIFILFFSFHIEQGVKRASVLQIGVWRKS